jgi:hypothetical protein
MSDVKQVEAGGWRGFGEREGGRWCKAAEVTKGRTSAATAEESRGGLGGAPKDAVQALLERGFYAVTAASAAAAFDATSFISIVAAAAAAWV